MLIDLHNLHHTYGSDSKSIQALQEMSFSVPSGQFLAVVGSSGCGKSTLLRILAGLLQPTAGNVSLNGAGPREAAAQKQIGWMAQSPALLPWHTVRRNIELAHRINPQNSSTPSDPMAFLKMVRLEDFADSYPQDLSGGMQQRAALARTLSFAPHIWLMDEPFAALDALTREELAHEVLSLWTSFKPTVIWVTHNLLEAVLLADRVLVMSPRPGRITADLEVSIPRPRKENTAVWEFVKRIRAFLKEEP